MAKQVYVCTCGFSTKSKARAVMHVTVPAKDGKSHNIRGI